MKKSEIYYKSQTAVLVCPSLRTADKLEILRVLMMEEDLEKFGEEREEREALNKLMAVDAE